MASSSTPVHVIDDVEDEVESFFIMFMMVLLFEIVVIFFFCNQNVFL